MPLLSARKYARIKASATQQSNRQRLRLGSNGSPLNTPRRSPGWSGVRSRRHQVRANPKFRAVPELPICPNLAAVRGRVQRLQIEFEEGELCVSTSAKRSGSRKS